jgi:hypothetical protein
LFFKSRIREIREIAKSLQIALLEVIEVVESSTQDGDDFVDFRAVHAEFGVALTQGVESLVLFQTVALEAKALRQLLDLGPQDEMEVFLAEVALTLRAVDGAVLSRFEQLEYELALALWTFEDFGQHREDVAPFGVRLSSRNVDLDGPV